MDSRVAAPKDSGFRSFAEFYPFYLSEHRHPVSRVLHYARHLGLGAVRRRRSSPPASRGGCWARLFCGYSFAWIGHFRFERNGRRRFAIRSTAWPSDFRMWWELNLGRLKFREHPTS